MIRCIKCNQVDRISKAGKVKGRQRYYCKSCEIHFLFPQENDAQKEESDRKQAVTIKDIAQALHISFSTVSKALLNSDTINSETRKRVQEMAAKMNYQPNLNAKTLATHTSKTIGIIIPSIINSSFYPEVIQGVHEILSEKKYSSIICLSHESYEIEVANCAQLINSRVDGVLMAITSQTMDTAHIKQFHENNIPIVFVNRAPENSETSTVTVNNYEAGCKATEHLIHQGCNRIAHIAGPPNLAFSTERLRGYTDTLVAYGLPIQPELIVHNDLYIVNSKECVKSLLSLANRPDGIFAYTDIIGIEVIQAAKQMGIIVPNDLRVIGMGNNSIATIIDPPLSSINGATVEMGKIAAELLLDEIENKTTKRIHRLLDVELVARRSTQF